MLQGICLDRFENYSSLTVYSHVNKPWLQASNMMRTRVITVLVRSIVLAHNKFSTKILNKNKRAEMRIRKERKLYPGYVGVWADLQ